MTGLLRDLRLAVHSLGRSPGFTLVAIVTLGLGIGANTSMFSVLHGYLLRPVPYPDSDRIDRIYRATPRNSQGGVSPADYLALKAEMGGYGEIAGYASAEMSVAEPGQPAEMTLGVRASANLFATLGSGVPLGRGFRPDEEVAGNHRVLVLSHRYWQNRFGGAADVVGRTVRVDGEAYEIVGVLPETFSDWRHLKFADLFQPLVFDEATSRDRDGTWIRLVGRRSASIERAQAAAFVREFGARRAAEFPATNGGTSFVATPIVETFLPGTGRRMIGMLIGLSGFVLLIACSNLANLLLARTMARAREFALRAALGGSRAQVLRPLVLETLLLALAGGACALAVARWTFDWLAVHSAGDSGVGIDLQLDWAVLAWAFSACVFTAVAFGVAPALFAQRLDLNRTLKSGGRGSTGDAGHRRFRNALIVGQFALAMVLLAGAALFAYGIHDLNHRHRGWAAEPLVTGTMVLPATAYRSDKEVADLHRLALDRVEALPGVASASISYALPFFPLGETRRYLVAGQPAPETGHEPSAALNGVSPRYFETLGIQVLQGRAFQAQDTAGSPKVYVINQSMAQALFGTESAIGQRLGRVGETTTGEIVGVVGDVEPVYTDRAPVRHQVYQPLAQEPRRLTELAVRADGVAPEALVAAIRTAIMSLDPDLPVRKLQPAPKTIARANYQLGVLASLLNALALLGLGLASLGVYGVIARTTAQRTAEFGIRLALGARAADITRLVLTSGAKLALLGSALGVLGALGVVRLIVSGFPGMRFEALPVLCGAALLLGVVAQVACYLPARAASRISPSEALRTE
jgi:putative ABC transport system permease protein